MHKNFITLFTLIISLSLFAKTGKVVIIGEVQNNLGSSVVISYLNNRELVKADLDADGKFSISTKLEDGFYFLKYGRNTAYIYLYPKDNLTIVFDAKDFENSIVFEGKGSARNNYLVKKSIVESELTKDLDAFYKVDESGYLKNITNVKNTHETLLSSYEVEDYFKKAELKSLEYERLLSIQNYKTSYKFYLGDDISPSEEFYKPLEAIDENDVSDYKKQPYFRYLVNSAWNKRIEATSDVDEMIKVFRKVPSEDLALTLLNSFYSKISSNKERSKDYLDLIKRLTTYQPFIEASEKQYQEVINSKGLNKGDKSPAFNYEDLEGKTISLSDLKGKYVYIDVWATWCGPCIKQVPYLKKLEERYNEKNIVFVSISVDKENVKEKWKQMIADNELGGVQLFADKSFDSDFMNAYAVNSIPRFILIDTEGNILDTEAPRPSFDKTRVLLDELLD